MRPGAIQEEDLFMFDYRVIHLALRNVLRSVEFTARSGKHFLFPDITRSSAQRIAHLTYTELVTTRVGIVYSSTHLHIRPVT